MFLDRAGWHQAKALVVPENLTLDWLPAYSPQCNPQELSGEKCAGSPLAITIMIRWTRSKTPWNNASANWNPHPPKSNPHRF